MITSLYLVGFAVLLIQLYLKRRQKCYNNFDYVIIYVTFAS